MEHLGDITKISGYTAPTVDCIIGGSPCQDLSVAGKRAGLDGERSGLYIEQVRIVKEMRAQDERNGRTDVDIRPRYMVWENVPGAFSSNKGEDFRIVLEELAKVKDKDAVVPMPPNGKWTNSGCIMGDGWSIAWRVLDAQFWGVPQRRRRIALVADFGGESAPEILFVRESVSGHTEPGEQKREEIASDASRGFGADDSSGCLTPWDCQSKRVFTSDAVFPSMYSGESAGQSQQAVCYGISSYDSNAMKSDNPHSGIYEADTSRTLDVNGGNPACNQGGIAIVQSAGFKELNSAKARSDAYEHEKSPCLSANKHDASVCIQVVDSVPYTLKIRSGCEGGGKGALIQENKSATLATNNDQYLFQPTEQYLFENHSQDSRYKGPLDVSPMLPAQLGTGGNNTPFVIALDRASFNQGQNAQYDPQYYTDGTNPTLVSRGPSGVSYNNGQRYIVRRLTPLECERLQGYPDGWTDIGEYIDTNGKKRQTSDAARYKALGNSIALPPWKWVLKRLCACYERDATMASLFDGIGGFPYLWEQINGKGTCLWASEIEEFPIAVTKARIL